MQIGPLDIEIMFLAAHEQPSRDEVDDNAHRRRDGHGPPLDHLGIEELADTLPYDADDGREQYYGVDQRNQHRSLLVAERITRRGMLLDQFHGNERQQQAGNIAQVVPRIGYQAHGSPATSLRRSSAAGICHIEYYTYDQCTAYGPCRQQVRMVVRMMMTFMSHNCRCFSTDKINKNMPECQIPAYRRLKKKSGVFHRGNPSLHRRIPAV